MDRLPRSLAKDSSGSSTNTGIIGHMPGENMAPAMGTNAGGGWTNGVPQIGEYGIGSAPKGLAGPGGPGGASEREPPPGGPPQQGAGGFRMAQPYFQQGYRAPFPQSPIMYHAATAQPSAPYASPFSQPKYNEYAGYVPQGFSYPYNAPAVRQMSTGGLTSAYGFGPSQQAQAQAQAQAHAHAQQAQAQQTQPAQPEYVVGYRERPSFVSQSSAEFHTDDPERRPKKRGRKPGRRRKSAADVSRGRKGGEGHILKIRSETSIAEHPDTTGEPKSDARMSPSRARSDYVSNGSSNGSSISSSISSGGNIHKAQSTKPEQKPEQKPERSPGDGRTMMTVISSHRGRLSAKMRRDYEQQASKYSLNNQQHGALQSFKVSPGTKVRRRRRRRKDSGDSSGAVPGLGAEDGASVGTGQQNGAGRVEISAEEQKKLVESLLREQDKRREVEREERRRGESVEGGPSKGRNDGDSSKGPNDGDSREEPKEAFNNSTSNSEGPINGKEDRKEDRKEDGKEDGKEDMGVEGRGEKRSINRRENPHHRERDCTLKEEGFRKKRKQNKPTHNSPDNENPLADEDPKVRNGAGPQIGGQKSLSQHEQTTQAHVGPCALSVPAMASPAGNGQLPYESHGGTRETIGSVAASVAAWKHEGVAPAGAAPAGGIEGTAMRQQPMTREQEKTFQGTNGQIMNLMLGPQHVVGNAPGNVNGNAIGNPPHILQQLMGSVPPEAVLPGVPSIPTGYIPMLMSPQGFLIPMQYHPVSTRGDVIPLVRPVWTGGLLDSARDIDRRAVEHEVASVLAGMPLLRVETAPQIEGFRDSGALLKKGVPSENKEAVASGDEHEGNKGLEPKNSGKALEPAARRRKLPPVSREERLAATRVCIMSHDSYRRTGRRKTLADIGSGPAVVVHEGMVVRYLQLENSLSAPGAGAAGAVGAYRARRRHLERKLRVLSGNLCDAESDAFLHGLERDTREIRDYDLVREEMFAGYRREQVLLHALDRTLELRSHVALDYTTRLLKLKKYLLRSRHALASCQDQLFYVNSSKSERLWRCFLERQQDAQGVRTVGEGADKAVAVRSAQAAWDVRYDAPHHRGRRKRPRFMAFPAEQSETGSLVGSAVLDSPPVRDSGSDSPSSVSSRVSCAARSVSRQRSARSSRAGRPRGHVTNSKSLLADELMPIIGEDDFAELTRSKSKVYESYIMHSPYPEVADQSDIVGLIEFFRCRSTLSDLFDILQPVDHRKVGQKCGQKGGQKTGQKNAPNSDENDPYSRFYPSRDSSPAVSDGVFHRHARINGLNITSALDSSLPDEDRVKWLVLDEKLIRTKFTKAYKKLAGLTNTEIDHDIRTLYPDLGTHAS